MRASDYITGDSFTLVRTEGGWWATTPAPSNLGRYYPPAYYGDSGARRFPAAVEWLQRKLYRSRAQAVTRAAGASGRVLDVGCGPGHLLAEFKQLGWEPLGTEATEEAAAIARRIHGLEVREGDLRDLRLSSNHFDAVVSWHTLEHMREPGVVLDEIARVLKPGGVLLISVPDFGSPEARANPAAWFHLDVPRHLAHFPAAVLRTQLERRGFAIERHRHFAPEYDAFSLVQTWQNRLGLPHNLLYLLLKSAARAGSTKPSAAQCAAAWVLGAMMLPAAEVVALWRARRKTGAVVEFLARKTVV